jgi:serine/threonine protein kinase
VLYSSLEALDQFEDPELAVAQTVMTQLLNALQQMHAAGLVHRDVKVRGSVHASPCCALEADAPARAAAEPGA